MSAETRAPGEAQAAVAPAEADIAATAGFVEVPEARRVVESQWADNDDVPTGTLLVRVQDAAANAVAGVELQLVPPAFSPDPDWRRTTDRTELQRLAAQVSAKDRDARLRQAIAISIDRMSAASDSDGLVIWQDIPAAAGYRFAVRSRQHVQIDPPNERQLLTAAGEAIVAGNDGDESLSGKVTVMQGESTAHSVTVLTSGSVCGRVITMPQLVSADVELFGVQSVSTATGLGAVALRQEAFLETAKDGRFEIVDVAPGPKVLRAHWRSGDDFWFTTATFELESGRQHDLGNLHRTRGSTVEIRVGLVDDEGRRLDSADTIEPGAMAMLGIDTVPTSKSVEDSIEAFMPIALDRTCRMHGVPDGRLCLRVKANRRWRIAAPGLVVERPASVDTHAPSAKPFTLDLIVRRNRTFDLCVEFPRGVPATPLDLVLINSCTGSIREEAYIPEPGDDARRSIKLSATGDHDRIIAMGGTEERSWYGEAAVSASTWLSMRPAASVRGVARNLGGDPVAACELSWHDAAWSGPGFSFRATSDAAGKFTLIGLPPRRWLTGESRVTGFMTPAIGSIREVVVSVR